MMAKGRHKRRGKSCINLRLCKKTLQTCLFISDYPSSFKCSCHVVLKKDFLVKGCFSVNITTNKKVHLIKIFKMHTFFRTIMLVGYFSGNLKNVNPRSLRVLYHGMKSMSVIWRKRKNEGTESLLQIWLYS